MRPGYQVPRIDRPGDAGNRATDDSATPDDSEASAADDAEPSEETASAPAGSIDAAALSGQPAAPAQPPAVPIDDIVKGMSQAEQDRLMNDPAAAQAAYDQHVQYTGDLQANRPAFVPGNPTPDDLNYADFLRRQGYLSADGPGFWSTLGHVVAQTAEGAGTVAGMMAQGGILADDQPKEEAKAQAVAKDTFGAIKAQYQALLAGSGRLIDKGTELVSDVLANMEHDPAMAAQVKSADLASWYKMNQRLTQIATQQQAVHSAATAAVVNAGWSEDDLNKATAFTSAIADPGQYVLGYAGSLASKAISSGVGAAARAIGLGAPKVELGVADGLRAEVATAAQKVSAQERLLNHLDQVGHLGDPETFAADRKEASSGLATFMQELKAKQAALNALDATNSANLANMGQPGFAGQMMGSATANTGGLMEKFGTALASMNQGVVDAGLAKVGDDAPDWIKGGIKHATVTRTIGAGIGAVYGYAEGDSWESGWGGGLAGAAVGGRVPEIIEQVGRLTRILGENYLLGKTTVPYFARMASDAEANGFERWAFRMADKFTPAVDFAKQTAKGVTQGAAIGAGLGIVASGGDDTDLAQAAGGGAAGHFTPIAMVSSLEGFWNPVQSRSDYWNQASSNLRLLQRRWASSDNLSRLNALTPTNQLVLLC